MEDRSLAILVTVFFVAAAIAACLALFVYQTAEAAPASFCEDVTFLGVILPRPDCFAGRCVVYVDLRDQGNDYMPKLTGWGLRQYQRVNVKTRICNGAMKSARIVR